MDIILLFPLINKSVSLPASSLISQRKREKQRLLGKKSGKFCQTVKESGNPLYPSQLITERRRGRECELSKHECPSFPHSAQNPRGENIIVTFWVLKDPGTLGSLRRQSVTCFLELEAQELEDSSSTEVISSIAKKDTVIFAEIKLMLTFLYSQIYIVYKRDIKMLRNLKIITKLISTGQIIVLD